MLAITVQRAHP